VLQILSTGLEIERLDAILTRLSQSMRDIYGSDINIDPDTPDGQMIGIFSQACADINEIISGVYAMSDPTKAVGVWLDIQLKYVGLTRNRQEYSYLNNVTITATNGTVIPSGFTVTDENGVEWQSTSQATVTGSSTSMQFRSSQYGGFNIGSGKELIPKNIILGVQSVITTTNSLLGRLQESDESALMRFLRSYSINNLDDAEGLEASLLSIDDVRDAKVYENYTGSIDARGVEPHSINAIVIGGSDEDIANRIVRKKSLGCGLQGAVSVTIFYKGFDRDVRFDRSEQVDISVKITVVRRSSAIDVNQDTIKNAIANNQFNIADDVVAGSLYCGTNNENYKVKSITLSTSSLTDQLVIPIGLRQHGLISAENVEVTVE
jgi:Uncharacterized homolog of phage Mu protein gp47